MTAQVGCSALAVFSTSRPVLPPIFRSLTTTSKKPSWSSRWRRCRSGASSTSWPASATAWARPRRSESWSSAISIRPMLSPHPSPPATGSVTRMVVRHRRGARRDDRACSMPPTNSGWRSPASAGSAPTSCSPAAPSSRPCCRCGRASGCAWPTGALREGHPGDADGRGRRLPQPKRRSGYWRR